MLNKSDLVQLTALYSPSTCYMWLQIYPAVWLLCFIFFSGEPTVWQFSSHTSSEAREEKMPVCHKHPRQCQPAVQERQCVQIPLINVSDEVKRPVSETKEYTRKESHRVCCCVWRRKPNKGIAPKYKDSVECDPKETDSLNQKKKCGEVFWWRCILKQMFGPPWNSICSSDGELRSPSSRWCFNTCLQWVQQCSSTTWCGHSKSNTRREQWSPLCRPTLAAASVMHTPMQSAAWHFGGRHTREGLWAEGDMEEEEGFDVVVQREGPPLWFRCVNSQLM